MEPSRKILIHTEEKSYNLNNESGDGWSLSLSHYFSLYSPSRASTSSSTGAAALAAAAGAAAAVPAVVDNNGKEQN